MTQIFGLHLFGRNCSRPVTARPGALRRRPGSVRRGREPDGCWALGARGRGLCCTTLQRCLLAGNTGYREDAEWKQPARRTEGPENLEGRARGFAVRLSPARCVLGLCLAGGVFGKSRRGPPSRGRALGGGRQAGTPGARAGGKLPSVGWGNAARVVDGARGAWGLSSGSSRAAMRVERESRSGPESAHLSSLRVRCDASRGNSTAALADEQWTPPPKGRYSCRLATVLPGATQPGPLAFPHLNAIQVCLAGRP